jgi:hypothetical protein
MSLDIPSYSLSLSFGRMASSVRDQRQIEIQVRANLPRLISSRSAQRRYREPLSLLLAPNPFTLTFPSTPNLNLAIDLKEYHKGRNTMMSLLLIDTRID